MKIGNAVVMVVQKTPDGQGALCVVIKGAVHKFDLPGLGRKKISRSAKTLSSGAARTPFSIEDRQY